MAGESGPAWPIPPLRNAQHTPSTLPARFQHAPNPLPTRPLTHSQHTPNTPISKPTSNLPPNQQPLPIWQTERVARAKAEARVASLTEGIEAANRRAAAAAAAAEASDLSASQAMEASAQALGRVAALESELEQEKRTQAEAATLAEARLAEATSSAKAEHEEALASQRLQLMQENRLRRSELQAELRQLRTPGLPLGEGGSTNNARSPSTLPASFLVE